MLFETSNIEDPILCLKKAIHILTALPNPQAEQVLANEIFLKEIVINEAWKAFLTKEIDSENKDGVFSVYKSVVNNVVQMIQTINPNYLYPNMLVTTVIEGSNQQRFFGQHLPKLTNSSSEVDFVEQFYQDMIFKAIQHG
jgi:predicted molibdopterin-dependent oxidoreductase YjgC